MKNPLFRKAILLPLLFACFSLFAQDPTIITYPLNNSVFQQNSNGQANISIAGQILKGGYLTEITMNQRLFINVEQYDYTSKTWSLFGNYKFDPAACVNCDIASVVNDPRTFYARGGTTIPTLNKGWYRAKVIQEIRCPVGGPYPTRIVRTISTTVNFGVGDVYMIAGQSNASGFTRIYDTDLMTFESNSLNGSPKISDNDILEGTIINRILTGNRDDALRAVTLHH